MSIHISSLSLEPSGASRFRRAGLRMGVLLISLFLAAAAAQAQFTYTTNNGALTVSKYTGTGGAVTIPDTYNGLPVVGIGGYAFQYCSSLTNITIPNSVTSIGNNAFYSCGKLTSLTLPNGVTSIGNNAFRSCSSLTSLTIPNSVTSIGDWAFSSCSSLTSLMIPNSVTSIGNGAFSSCSSLTSLTIPNGVTNIGNYAFQSSRLTSLTIPNSVTSIGIFAFRYCSRLTSVYFRGNAPTPSNDTTVFEGSSATIYYLVGTTGWEPTFCGRPTALYTIAPPPTIAPPMIHGTNLTLNWTAVPGKNYIVEYRADLISGDWTTVTNLPATQTDMSFTLPVTGTQGYYRLGVAP